MSSLVYTLGSGSSNRNIAAEAFQKAVNDLKNELQIADANAAWLDGQVDIQNILGTVDEAKEQYDERSKEHSGTRAWLEKFSCRVMIYGKVFDALAQHHPEYVALAWGAVKFVLIGIINRATLVQKLAQAFVAIGDVLPRAHLSAELYQTDYMRDALSRLYAYIMLFLRLCVRWYNRSSLGRLWSAIKSPFELDYQDLVDQIKVSSAAVEDLASASARVEVRDIRVIQDVYHNQFVTYYERILERQSRIEDSVTQLMQVAISSKTLTEQVSIDVKGISQTTYRLEFHHLVNFLAPVVRPDTALLKVQSFTRRDPSTSLPSPENAKLWRTLHDWASSDRSALLIIRMGLRAQKQARNIAADVIHGLTTSSRCVFWNLSLPSIAEEDASMASVFKSLIHQALQHSAELFAQFSEQLNLLKVRSTHTDSEWADLICLLFSKIPNAFVVVETEGLRKMYQHDGNWMERLLKLLQRVVDQTSAAGNQVKILLVVYGQLLKIEPGTSSAGQLSVTSVAPLKPVPARLRHVARRAGFETKGWKLKGPKK